MLSYSFSSFKRFNFFSPFGFVSFLNRIYETAYHFKYKRDCPLFVLARDEVIDIKEKQFVFEDLFDPERYKLLMAEIKKREERRKAALKSRRPLTIFTLRSFFSRYFLRSIGFFRKKFFFSFLNNFKHKVTRFFHSFSFNLDSKIADIRRSIYLKFKFFFSKLNKLPFSIFFFGKFFNRYYYNFFRLFIFSKFFFLKKELFFLRRLVFFRIAFKRLFLFANKSFFFKIFSF